MYLNSETTTIDAPAVGSPPSIDSSMNRNGKATSVSAVREDVTANTYSAHLTTSIVSPYNLNSSQLNSWQSIILQVPELGSPYFQPAFTRAVAGVRGDVEVAVISQGDRDIGFFPFQRDHKNVGQPVGGRLSDYHGIIARPNSGIDVETLLRDCNLSAWQFDHLVDVDHTFESHVRKTDGSYFLDLANGFDAYCDERRKSGSKRIKKINRLSRKLAKEVGPVRVERFNDNDEALNALLRWKSEQYQRTGIVDLFSFDWVVQLLENILQNSSPRFSGAMFVLYVGDRIAAVDMGMQSGSLFHSWFPSYDRELAQYSPSHILLLETARMAESLGIKRIELGKGEEPYKQSFRSGSVTIGEGCVDLRPWRRRFNNLCSRLTDVARQSPFIEPLRKPVRALRKLRDRHSLR